MGEVHSDFVLAARARASTSCFFATALARAISTASVAAASMPSGGQIVGRRETPGAAVEHADPESERDGIRQLADFSVLGGDVAVLGFDQPHVGVRNAAAHGGIECIDG